MAANYPLPVFHFTVEWGGTRIGFSEVTGLTQENQAIEYRDGSFPEYSSIKMPGLRKFSNLTLKRGVKSDNDFSSGSIPSSSIRLSEGFGNQPVE